MRKILAILVCAIFGMASLATAADVKISELPEATAVTSDDLFVITDAPATTPTSKKVTAANASVGSLLSPATTGVTTITGPGAGQTRVMTIPDADFTALYKSGAYPDGAMLGADGTAGAVKSLGVPITMTSDTTGPKYYSQTAATWESGSYAQTPVIDDPDNFAANFTGANLYGGTFIANAAGTAALPEPAAGMNFTIVLEGANAVIIDPLGTGTADTIVMNGLAAAADENITSSTSGAMCVFQYRAANSWMATCNGFVEATPP